MRLLGVSAVLLAALTSGCGAEDDEPGASAPSSQLTITVWPTGAGGGDAQSWTLQCDPAGGTHPNAAEACARLAAVPAAFEPVSDDVACTEIYGGPQEARVEGTFRGRAVDARFNRVNGCEIARWDRVAALFPISVGAA